MKVVWTEAALSDLDEILAYTADNYPTLVAPVEERIRAVVARIGQWPKSARLLEQRPDIRVVPLLRFPYRIFYRVAADSVEILHVHHAAREAAEPRVDLR